MPFKGNGDLCTVYMCFWAKDDFSVTCSCTGATVNSCCNGHLCDHNNLVSAKEKVLNIEQGLLSVILICCNINSSL